MSIKVRTIIIFLISFILLLIILGGTKPKDFNDLYRKMHRDVEFTVDYKNLILDINAIKTKNYPKVHAEVEVVDKLKDCVLTAEGYVIKVNGINCDVYIGEELVHSFERPSAGSPISHQSRLKYPILAYIIVAYFLYSIVYTFMTFIVRKFVFRNL